MPSHSYQSLVLASGHLIRVVKVKGVARIWFRGGGATHFGGGGPDPLFFASDPKSQGSPLMYFWLPPDFGGGGPAPPPGYALGKSTYPGLDILCERKDKVVCQRGN